MASHQWFYHHFFRYWRSLDHASHQCFVRVITCFKSEDSLSIAQKRINRFFENTSGFSLLYSFTPNVQLRNWIYWNWEFYLLGYFFLWEIWELLNYLMSGKDWEVLDQEVVLDQEEVWIHKKLWIKKKFWIKCNPCIGTFCAYFNIYSYDLFL